MKALKWTSPIRRIQARELSPLPNEIYLEIFENLRPGNSEFEESSQLDRRSRQEKEADYRRTLSRLARVCRYFCFLALSHLLDSITFYGDKQITRLDTMSKANTSNYGVTPYGFGSGYASFCRFVNQGKEPSKSLANLVRECTFSSWGVIPQKDLLADWSRGGVSLVIPGENAMEENTSESSDTSWAVKGFIAMYSQAITRMPNLESLVLYDTLINNQLVTAIGRCTSLKSLMFRGCAFDKDVKGTDVLDMMRLLSKLEHFTLQTVQQAEIPAPDEIQERALDPTRNPFQSFLWPTPLHSLTLPYLFPSQIRPVIQRDAGVVFHQNLTSLDLTYVVEDDLAALFQFLDATTLLTSFKVSSIYSETQPNPKSYPIRKGGLTHLRTLSCPSLLAHSLLPGRRLRELDLSGMHIVDGFIGAISLLEPRDTNHIGYNWIIQSNLAGNLRILSMAAYNFVQIAKEGSTPGILDALVSEVTRLELKFTHLNFGTVISREVMAALHQMTFPKLQTLILDFPETTIPLIQAIFQPPISKLPPPPPPLANFHECHLPTHHAALTYLRNTTMPRLENARLVCDINWGWRFDSKAWHPYVLGDDARGLERTISTSISFGNEWIDYEGCLRNVVGDMEGVVDG